MLLILIIHFPLYSFAQNYHSKLINLNGHIKSPVTSMCQSNDGFIWLGTDLGIIRYDGTNYKTFKKNDNTSFNEIIDLEEDNKGNLWIHDLNGVYVLKNGVVSRLKVFDSLITNQLFFDLKCDNTGNVWLSSKGNVFKLSYLKNGETRIDQFKTNGEQAYGIFVDKANCIWVGTESGVCKIKENKLIKIIHLVKSRGHSSKVWNIYGVNNEGLYFNNNYINKVESQGKYTSICKIGDSPFCGVFSSVKGNLSVFYNDGKAALYEGFKHVGYLHPSDKALDEVSAFLIDNQQNIWVAYGNKLFKFTKFNLSWFPFPEIGYISNHFKVSVLKKINDSITLLGDMDYNIYILNSQLNKLNITPLLTRTKLSITNKSAYPTDIVFLNNDKFIISSMFNGLVKYNFKQNKAFAYPKYEKNDGYLNLTLIDNAIWSGATGFFAKINGDKIKFFEPPGFNDVTEVHSFVQYKNSDSIFIGTDMGIYLYYNNSVKRYYNSTIGKNKKVKLFKKDKDNVWVIVDGQGIYVLNIPANMVTPIKTKENCTEDFIGIHGFIDVSNKLWVKFSNRNYECLLEEISLNHFVFKIPRISNSTFDFFNFGKRVVLPFNKYFLQVNDSGVYKINLSNPDFFKKAKPVKIIGLKVRDIENDSLLQLGKCTLKHTEGNLTFSFSRIDFENTGPINYEYYLEGSGSKLYNFSTENTSVTFSNLSPGVYTFFVRSTGNYYENGEMPFASYQFRILPPWYFTWWAYTLWALFILSIFYLFFKLRIYTLKRNAEIERNMLEAELRQLRAQINPHYLSNSLMSLQNLILKDNKLLALEVLSRYGKVMRGILNNSEHHYVSLYTEISTLKDYMELEALLLFENAEFKIHYDTIDNELLQSIQIPSMLIQPYVENAIIHGLMPKNKAPYYLSVSFEFNDRLICTVQDNGVGRSPQVQNFQRISKGNENVENRLKLYGKLLQQTMTVEIIDLKNKLNEPIGTKVIIILPHSFNEI